MSESTRKMLDGIIQADPLSIKRERRRRLREEQLRYYKPYPKQLALHKSKAKIRAFLAANQTGKTKWGCVELAWIVGKVHPYRSNFKGPVHARDCCVDFGAVISTLLPHYMDLLPRNRCELPGTTFEGRKRIWPGLRGGSWESAYNTQEKMLWLEDESFIEFKSYDQGWKKFQGARRHIIREDEEPKDKTIHNENMLRQARYGTNMLITMTPINPSQWLHSDIFDRSAFDPTIECITATLFDNPYVSREFIEEMQELPMDPAERAARLYGEPAFLSGRVYKEYGEHNFIEPFIIPSNWEYSFVIDPHPEKPTAWNLFAESPSGNIFVVDEADLSGDVSFICKEIRKRCAGKYISLQLIDPAAASQGAKIHGRGKLIYEFRKYLPQLQLANNAVEPGIDAVRRMVIDNPGTGPLLKVFRTCPVTHHQMKNLSWKGRTATGEDRKKAQVIKRDDDHPDCIRYRIYSCINHSGTKFNGFGIGVYANSRR